MKHRLTRALSWAVFPALLVGGFAIAAPKGDGESGRDADAEPQTFEMAVPGPAPIAGVAIAHARAAGEDGDVVHIAGPGAIGMGPGGGDLTYAEFHSLRDGEEVVTRLDRGTVSAVDDDSVTITHNDDSEATIPVDGETKVLTPPPFPEDGERPDLEDLPDPSELIGEVSDLEVGDEVSVHREVGHAAAMIGILPQGGERPLMPAPPPDAPPAPPETDGN